MYGALVIRGGLGGLVHVCYRGAGVRRVSVEGKALGAREEGRGAGLVLRVGLVLHVGLVLRVRLVRRFGLVLYL